MSSLIFVGTLTVPCGGVMTYERFRDEYLLRSRFVSCYLILNNIFFIPPPPFFRIDCRLHISLCSVSYVVPSLFVSFRVPFLIQFPVRSVSSVVSCTPYCSICPPPPAFSSRLVPRPLPPFPCPFSNPVIHLALQHATLNYILSQPVNLNAVQLIPSISSNPFLPTPLRPNPPNPNQRIPFHPISSLIPFKSNPTNHTTSLSIPSHPIPSHPNLSRHIPSNPLHPIKSHPISPQPIPSHPIPSHKLQRTVHVPVSRVAMTQPNIPRTARTAAGLVPDHPAGQRSDQTYPEGIMAHWPRSLRAGSPRGGARVVCLAHWSGSYVW